MINSIHKANIKLRSESKWTLNSGGRYIEGVAK